jgi:hypothetical protein
VTSGQQQSIPLGYRAPARRAWPAWFSRDKLAELLIGLGWTFCGIAAILTVVCWIFLRMEPRQPISGPWWAFVAFCLAFNTIGLAMIIAALFMRFWPDSILVTLWAMTLMMALAVYLAIGYLVATAPAPLKPVTPMQFQAPEGQS